MEKKVRIQVTLNARLMSGLAAYQAVENCSKAQAGQDLMMLGLQLWEQSRQTSDQMSMIDTLEHILHTTYEIKVQQQLFAVFEVEKTADSHGAPYSLERLKGVAMEKATQKMKSLQSTNQNKK